MDDPGLAEADLEITAMDGGFVVSHRGMGIDTIRVLAPDGTLLVDGSQLGMSVVGDRHSQRWLTTTSPPPGSTLEATRYLGYRTV